MSDLEQLSNKQLLETLMKAIVDIREEIKLNKEDIGQQIKTETQTVIENLQEYSQNINTLSNRIDELEIRLITNDRLRRKNNILIFGLEIPKNTSLLNYTLSKLNDLLEVNLQESNINNIYQLRSTKTPAIKIEFVTFLKKDLILRNSLKLKGTKIFIGQDLCPEDRKNKKILVEHLKKARSKNYLAKIKGKTLEINGEIYTIPQLQELEKQSSNQSEEDFPSPTIENRGNSAPPTPTPSINIENNDYLLYKDNSEEAQINLKEVKQTRKTKLQDLKINTPPINKKREEDQNLWIFVVHYGCACEELKMY